MNDVNTYPVTVYLVARGSHLCGSHGFLPSMRAATKLAREWNRLARAEGTPANHKAVARIVYAPIPKY